MVSVGELGGALELDPRACEHRREWSDARLTRVEAEVEIRPRTRQVRERRLLVREAGERLLGGRDRRARTAGPERRVGEGPQSLAFLLLAGREAGDADQDAAAGRGTSGAEQHRAERLGDAELEPQVARSPGGGHRSTKIGRPVIAISLSLRFADGVERRGLVAPACLCELERGEG